MTEWKRIYSRRNVIKEKLTIENFAESGTRLSFQGPKVNK